jgi:hypothetical protein
MYVYVYIRQQRKETKTCANIHTFVYTFAATTAAQRTKTCANIHTCVYTFAATTAEQREEDVRTCTNIHTYVYTFTATTAAQRDEDVRTFLTNLQLGLADQQMDAIVSLLTYKNGFPQAANAWNLSEDIEKVIKKTLESPVNAAVNTGGQTAADGARGGPGMDDSSSVRPHSNVEAAESIGGGHVTGNGAKIGILKIEEHDEDSESESGEGMAHIGDTQQAHAGTARSGAQAQQDTHGLITAHRSTQDQHNNHAQSRKSASMSPGMDRSSTHKTTSSQSDSESDTRQLSAGHSDDDNQAPTGSGHVSNNGMQENRPGSVCPDSRVEAASGAQEEQGHAGSLQSGVSSASGQTMSQTMGPGMHNRAEAEPTVGSASSGEIESSKATHAHASSEEIEASKATHADASSGEIEASKATHADASSGEIEASKATHADGHVAVSSAKGGRDFILGLQCDAELVSGLASIARANLAFCSTNTTVVQTSGQISVGSPRMQDVQMLDDNGVKMDVDEAAQDDMTGLAQERARRIEAEQRLIETYVEENKVIIYIYIYIYIYMCVCVYVCIFMYGCIYVCGESDTMD